MSDEKTNDWFTRLQGQLAKLPDCSPEERDAFAAERKAMEGEWLETITMREDCSLMIVTTQYFDGGGQGQGCSESAPGDSDYEDLLQQHGALKPGQTHTLVRKMIDGTWVIKSNETEIQA